MKRMEFSLGSKKDNPKKEIDIQLKPRHLVFFFVFLMLIVLLVNSILLSTDIVAKEYKFECLNGTVENIEYGKEVYCGEHYTVLKQKMNADSYNKIERVILGIKK